ncbi:MAG: CAP domain-containing protein [Planctomycetales bacterium]|nr:CAP domain-containing protein [Planctomycetales bacterium]
MACLFPHTIAASVTPFAWRWQRVCAAICATSMFLVGSGVISRGAAVAFAQPLWSEDGEGGLGNVVDHTNAAYPLLQSEVASQGSYAFHLAHPSPQDNWFELDRTLTIGNQTKLFFQSRLGFATSEQVARVQASTDGGATWSVDLFAQPGDGGPGESLFQLRTVDLSSVANQDVRFRFLYEFNTGSYFPQASQGVGWYVDDIQVSDQFAKTLYSIGDPTPHEQLYLEYLNRARADALLEASRLAQETDPQIVASYDAFNVTPENIETQFAWYVQEGHIPLHAQPLSFNAKLLEAARLHSQDMFENEFQEHQSSANPPSPLTPNATLGMRMDIVDYQGRAGENIFAYAKSAAQGHAGFDVDWGNRTNFGPAYNPAFDGQGMQNEAGHRLNIHDVGFNEVGVGVINGTHGSVGPQVVTQDFGEASGAAFVTGVVYEDLNGNNFYDVGEGRGGIRVDVEGSGYYAVSAASGGYSIPVDGDGQYLVRFSGGGYADYAGVIQIADGFNAKVDYLVASGVAIGGDFDGDGDVDADDYARWASSYGSMTSDADADGDGDSDGGDLLVWQQQFGEGLAGLAVAVPEPAAWALAIFASGMAILHRRRV